MRHSLRNDPSGGRSRAEWSARTHSASGRFALAVVLLTGCQLAVGATPQPAGEQEAPVIIAPGPIDRADQQRASQLLDGAERAFRSRRFLEAVRLTTEIANDYPASNASGAALLLAAQSLYEVGDLPRADGFAERYAGLLAWEDPRLGDVRILQAETLFDQPHDLLDRLMRLGSSPRVEVRSQALAIVRELVASLSLDDLRAAADSAPRGGAASSPVYAELAVQLLARGEEEAATEYAIAGMESGATGDELTLVEGVLRDELPEELQPERSFEIASVLPQGGPPALAEFAGRIAEGIEVALFTVLGDDYDVSVTAYDDEADPITALEVVDSIEGTPAVGMVGFLMDDVLLSAGYARMRGVPIVSPTARSAARAGTGVYALDGADRAAAAAVGRYAATRAFQRVAMIYPNTPEAEEEADAFEIVADSFGIPVVGRFRYPEGATDFEAQFRPAQDALRAAEIAALGLTEEDTLFVHMLEPVGLFMPIPAEDVEFVGPQFAHQGLDTLAIEVMGTSGWTDAGALEAVDPRLLQGVVATRHVNAGPGSFGYARFRQAYEAYYQRSLVSGAPALGYDATMLLLEALRPGRLSPEEVRASFESLVDVEGATGVFSVVDGRIVRQTEVVWIDDGDLIPIPPDTIRSFVVDTLPARFETFQFDTLLLPVDTARGDTTRVDTLRVDTTRVDTLRTDTIPRGAVRRGMPRILRY